MRVYMKKEDKNTNLTVFILTIIFLSFSVSLLIDLIVNKKSFIDALKLYGSVLIFVIIFLSFSIYFIYYLIKRPKSYKAKLIKKSSEIYNGKLITYMKFIVPKAGEKEDFFEFECYTIGENNLILDKEYSLKIKELNWEPKCVEELQSVQNSLKNKVPNITLFPVHILIELIFGSDLFFCILGLIMYPQYAVIYIIGGVFLAGALYIIFKLKNRQKIYNNIIQNENDLKLESENISSLKKQKNDKIHISNDIWNAKQMNNHWPGERYIHIKEIDERLGRNYEFYSKIDKKGNLIFARRNLNLVPWVASLLLMLIVTIVCLYQIFSGSLNNDLLNLILFIIISIFCILFDIWLVFNFIDIIKIRRQNKKTKNKKSILTNFFSMSIALFVVSLIIVAGYMMYGALKMNTIGVEVFEKNLKHLFNFMMITGIVSFIIQGILAYQGTKLYYKNQNK